MKGYFRRRGCTCNKKKCTCGALWSYTVDVGRDPVTNKRKQKTASGFRTKAEAEEAANQLIYELNSGTYIEESDITFNKFVERWFPVYEQTHNVKPSTVRTRQCEARRLMSHLKNHKMKEITRSMYQQALINLKDSGLTDNTLSNTHACGRMIFQSAMEQELIKADPTQYAKLPKTRKTVEELEQERPLPKFLEKEELNQFLNATKEYGLLLDYEIFLTLAYTGMRVGELLALKWKDLDVSQQTISITKTYFSPKNNTVEYKLLTPKTNKSWRTVDLDPIVIKALLDHKAVQNRIKMQHMDVYHDKDFIFAKIEKLHYGYPLSIMQVENRMRRALRIAGLNTKLTPHSLRHTHTSLLAAAGVGLEEIMERLGHADDAITRHIYLHITKDKKKEAVQKFSSFMNSL